VIPLKLTLSGFLSYHAEVILDFTSFDLACISGSNGAGKSSLLDAMTWALFGRARKNNDEALINSMSDTAQVTFEFEYEKDCYRIQRGKTRGKTTLLEFQILNRQGEWVTLTEHALRETEKRIEQTLRMDYDTFINTSFFLQGKADQFTQQPAGRRKEILSNILGLEVWESYREVAANRRRMVESEQAGVTAWLSEVETELSQEEERVARLEVLEEELTRKSEIRTQKEALFESSRRQVDAVKEQEQMLQVMDAQLQDLQSQLATVITQSTDRKAEFESYETILLDEKDIHEAFQQLTALRQELEHTNQLATQFHQFELQRLKLINQISNERSLLDREIGQLQVKKKQIVEMEIGLVDLSDKLKQSAEQIAGYEGKLSQEPSRKEQLRILQQTQADLNSDNRRLKLLMEELKDRIVRLKSAQGATCPLCGQPLTAQHRSEMLIDLEGQGKILGGQYRENKKHQDENDKAIEEITGDLQSFQEIEQGLQQARQERGGLEADFNHATSEVDVWHKNEETRLTELVRQVHDEEYAPDERKQLVEIEKSIAVLGYDAARYEELRQQELGARAGEERYHSLEKAMAAIQPLKREIEFLDQQQEEMKAKIITQQVLVENAREKFNHESATMPDLVHLEMELNGIRGEENQFRLQVGAARQQVDVLEKQKERKRQLQAQQLQSAKKISLLEKLERAFGKNGVPALLIEQVLPDIEGKANQILDRLSSGGMSLKFETQRERKNKKDEGAIQTLDILVSDAAGVREYELFSGGEAFRINFAIRLALAHTLAKRAGARLQTLVIDEGFGSQDADGRQRLIEAINLVMENENHTGVSEPVSNIRKILVITHLDELKDAFPARIEVEKTLEGSKIQVMI
jgi:exonuclease SbcC